MRPVSRCRKSILVYGDSGDGKTALIGEYAEYLYRTERKRTRLYSFDPGGTDTIKPYINLGIIELIDMVGLPRGWEGLDAASRGKVLAPDGTWVQDDSDDIGCDAYDGFTGAADGLMQDLSRKAGAGTNVGGQAPAVKFKEGETTISGNSPAHFGIVQGQLTMAAQETFHRSGRDIIWTALARRASDNDTGSTILGPQIVGKALTGEAPRWFVYTFRVMGIPADAVLKTPERHILYFNDHTDLNTPGAKGLGNSRIPMGVGPVDPIEPASLVRALEVINSKSREAEGLIRERLQGMDLPPGR
jgi:hypothetical protein